LSDIVGTPQTGWVPVEVLLLDDSPAGDYYGLLAPAGFCLIVTDADVYLTGTFLPTDGVELIRGPVGLVFYSHLGSTGSGHWEGFQKFKGESTIGARVIGSGDNCSVAICGYLVQDYTTSELY
jgi:hypothetical protein